MENEIDLDLTGDSPQINRTHERISQLSSKVREKAEEADNAKKAAAEAESKRVAAEKERDFYASFVDLTGKYQGASEYKDKIKEKVMAGYSPEDATVAVLNAEGKLTPHVAPPAPPAPAAGGSAAINLPSSESKTLHEMSKDEKREALLEAIKRGDIGLSG